MSSTSLPTIASVSLSDFDKDPDAFADSLGRSFEQYGFAIIADHGISAKLIAEADQTARAFFALPEAEKRAYQVPGGAGARGYTPFGIETAKGASRSDLKEFWHVGRELAPGHRYEGVMPPNLWPSETPRLRESILALYAEFDRVGLRLLSAIAKRLRLPLDYFDDATRDGNSVLRLLHYPPVAPDAEGLRAGAHEDINAITLLLGAEEAGLELLDRDGIWRPVAPKEGELVVNVGDMLQRLTNHVLVSTSHRVVKPLPERRAHARYSMPYFLHFRPDFPIETLPQCISEEQPNRYPEPITADAFLMQRLRDIGLI